MPDPYTTLQVGRDASPDEIKRAFRRLAKELHPDLNPNNPSSARRFKDIAAAYDMLSDAQKRNQYDRQVSAASAASQQRADPRPPTDDGLDSFFSRRGWGFGRTAAGPGARQRGADIFQSLRVGFLEAALGARKRVAINDQRVLDIVVPALTQDGQTLRLKGQGHPGKSGGIAGDLLVDVTVDPHPLFTRKDHDITMTLAVTLPEAVLGASITVPTVHGTVQIKVPKGSNSGSMLRLKGKGLPIDADRAGDQYVTLKIVLPDPPDPELTEFVAQWASRRPYSTR